MGRFILETAVESAPCREFALAQRIGKNDAITIWVSAVQLANLCYLHGLARWCVAFPGATAVFGQEFLSPRRKGRKKIENAGNVLIDVSLSPRLGALARDSFGAGSQESTFAKMQSCKGSCAFSVL